jgi:predicted DNA-binding transcriptional regulator YafY
LARGLVYTTMADNECQEFCYPPRMRASRLLSILLLLQARGRLNAAALAAEFEVSVRTIYRDIDALSAAGVPVYADRGPGGGFQLLDGYRTRLTGLSPDEAASLFLAGLPGPAAELGLADALAAATLKLDAALPERMRATAHRVAARFHLDPVGWFRSAETARFLPEIAEAVWSERCIDIRYRRGGGAAARRLRPLGLVLKAGTWYLVALAGEQPRTYRISNILGLSILDEGFDRPPGFDLERFWTAASRAYEAGLQRGEAVLRVSPRGLASLERLGTAAAREAAAAAGPADPRGWVRIIMPIESVEQAAAELMRLGAEAEVLEPAALRRRIAASARALSRLYDAETARRRTGVRARHCSR